MNSVQIEQKSYEMPARDGFTVTHFLTVADIDRSARFYETVFGSRILSRGDGKGKGKGAPGYIQTANTWLIVKPLVTTSIARAADEVSLHGLQATLSLNIVVILTSPEVPR